MWFCPDASIVTLRKLKWFHRLWDAVEIDEKNVGAPATLAVSGRDSASFFSSYLRRLMVQPEFPKAELERGKFKHTLNLTATTPFSSPHKAGTKTRYCCFASPLFLLTPDRTEKHPVKPVGTRTRGSYRSMTSSYLLFSYNFNFAFTLSLSLTLSKHTPTTYI